MDRDPRVIEDIENNLLVLKKEAGKLQTEGLDNKWKDLLISEPKRFLNPNLTVKEKALKNFRKHLIFVPDQPSFSISRWNLKTILGGGRRGSKKLLVDCLNVLERNNYEKLLKKFPCSKVGNPNIFKYKGYEYTYRWAKHIYSLGLFKKVLGKMINEDFITLDIGSSYGIFSYLLKHEFGKCHCVLLDFPEQLVLAHYFLAMNFPDASIAGFADVLNAKNIDRDFLKKYDFIFIPWFLYDKISSKSIDLVTNFASFGEMRKEWFKYYTENEVFASSKYFFTENRFQSAPTYDTDLTVLDYHLNEFKALHFRICPIFSHAYRQKFIFFYEKLVFSSQYFEFVGERK